MNRPLRRAAILAGIGGALVLVGAILRHPWQRTASLPTARDARVAAGAPSRQQRLAVDTRKPGLAVRQPASPDEAAALPRSLEGTDVDGWLGVDDDGHLVVTPGARWFFDYFLSATGEESPSQIRDRIVAEIEKRLPPAGAGEAVDLLDRYVAYRDRVRALQASSAPADLQRRLVELHQIRQEIFGDVAAAALFGEEEQVVAVDLQRRQVLSDTTLSADERERRLNELDEQLPSAARAARSAAMTVAHLNEDEQQLRATGASAEEIRVLREQRVGAEAADRLEALDGERAAWQQRLDEYRSARQAIESNVGLTADARTQAVDQLLTERFTPQERLRVEALDQIQQANR